MNETESPRNVVVTDIKMPFWSMVIFMVKWAIAAIPALLLLAAVGVGVTFVFLGLVASTSGSRTSSQPMPEPVHQYTPPRIRVEPFAPNTPDRCKGSPEIEKCIERESRSSNETSEMRTKRQAELDASRKSNMDMVK